MRANKPSRTAYKVAINIISLGSKAGMDKILPPGIVDATEKLLIASGAASEGVVNFAGSQWAVSIYEWFDWLMPGQFEAFGKRKAFCEAQVRKAIKCGATQSLVLGAGYDTLGWRLAPEFPEVNFFEIDHPATAGPKAKGIAKMGSNRNLHLVSEDLGRRKLSDVLANQENWDLNAPSVIIAEGLLMYLRPEAVSDLFTQTAAATGQSSRIFFTYFPSGKDGRPDIGRWTGLLLWLMRSSGEPWLWSIPPGELEDFLKTTGWIFAPAEIEGSGRCGLEYLGAALKDGK
jgi:methyltransferase (TIGR00027 family)